MQCVKLWSWRLLYYVTSWMFWRMGAWGRERHWRLRDHAWPEDSRFVWRTRRELENYLRAYGLMLRVEGHRVYAWSFQHGEHLLSDHASPMMRWSNATRGAVALVQQLQP